MHWWQSQLTLVRLMTLHTIHYSTQECRLHPEEMVDIMDAWRMEIFINLDNDLYPKIAKEDANVRTMVQQFAFLCVYQ